MLRVPTITVSIINLSASRASVVAPRLNFCNVAVTVGRGHANQVIDTRPTRAFHRSDGYWKLFSKGHYERCAFFMLGPCSRQSRPPRFVSSESTLGERNGIVDCRYRRPWHCYGQPSICRICV